MTLDDELSNTSRMRFQSSGRKEEYKPKHKKKKRESDEEEELVHQLKDMMKNPKSDNHSSRSFDSDN